MSRPAESLPDNPTVLMRSIIQRIATGPELSKDISYEEAQAGMQLILEGKVDPVQAAIFFIALRMKRETDDENLGVLQAIRESTRSVSAAVDELIDIADPYDGYNRTMPASIFLPAVLASLGIPAVSHGVETLGPKYGVTHKKVLRAAGLPVDLSPEEAAKRIEDPAIGWSYIDQSQFCPPLHDLIGLRSQIVKRPVLTTVEVLAKPLSGRVKTHFMSGYVHKPYPRIYALLARHVGFDSMLLVRGVEGGVVPSLRQAGKSVFYHDKGPEQELDSDPKTLGIEQDVRAAGLPEDLPPASDEGDEIALPVDINAFAQAVADAGMEALQGKPGPIRDGLIYAGALALNHLGKVPDLKAGADAIRTVLDEGKALGRVKA